MNTNRGVLLLLTFSLFTGLGGYFVKQTSGINPQQILFFLAILASLFIFIVALVTKRLKELKFRLPFQTILMGAAQGLSIYFFYAALEKTTVASTMMLVYTAPIFSAIFASIFLKEKIAQNTVLGILMSLIGVLLISNPSEFKIDSNHMVGSIYALLGGFFYAAMAISSKSLTEKTKPIYTAFWQYFIIMVMTAFFAKGVTMAQFSANFIPLAYLGCVAGGLAFIIYMQGIKLVRGQYIQIITMMEVLVGTLSGVILLKEPLPSRVMIGGLLILGGVLVVSAKKNLLKR